jgi:nitrite reductase/ring-hydroxylating ferredoxin subunit
MPFVKAATIGDIDVGKTKVVSLNKTTVVIANVEGEFYAIDDYCPHQGASLGCGFFKGKNLSCPLHGWTFDVTTGEASMPAGVRVDKFDTKVEGDDILVDVPE